MKSLYTSSRQSEREGEGLELEVVTAPTVEPVTLEEAKSYCRIDGTDDDAQITKLIIACRKEAERVTNRAFITQTILAQWERMHDYVILPRSPHQQIIRVDSYDGNNWHTLNSSQYRLTGLHCFRINVSRRFSTLTQLENPFRVQYEAGEGDDEDHIDERIGRAILDMVLVAFDNRGQVKTADGAELTGLMTPAAAQYLSGLTTYR
jgi:uncharacterized phiE125 gp8 family phage protein